jgi:methylated-DNA-protein-cysteine methyltransferase-like protein
MKTFSERVVKLVLSVPKGRVTTYGALSRAAGGDSMAAQSIMSILGKAWQAGNHNIPFHRIVYADGRIWIDMRHKKERIELYKKEKIVVDKRGYIQNFRDVLFEFN